MHALSSRRISAAFVAAVALLALLTGCGGSSKGDTGAASGSSLPTRTATAGPVEVRVTPRAIDAAGARFSVELDNHEIDLTGDYAAASALTVGGQAWSSARWSGAGPGGHHRSGTLMFTSGGPAAGQVELRLGGMPSPVTLRWTIQTQ